MSTTTSPSTEREQRVTPLELFFDLVFVFALTQVTRLLADDASWEGMARGVLVLAALWWAWVGYAWLTNQADTGETATRLLMFAAMGAMLVASLAVPDAFGEYALLFAIAYTLVRWIHVVLLVRAPNDIDVRRAAGVFALTATPAPALLIAASFLDGLAQGLVWVVALLIDYAGPVVTGGRGWRVSPEHFAERHGLIVIVALGESIVAVGLSSAGVGLTVQVVLGALAGLAVAIAFWWTYFDVVAIVAARKLASLTGVARNRLARDSYSLLHLPMIVGIEFFAFGAEEGIHHVDAHMEPVPAVALCGGVALYYIGHVGFRLRNMRTIAIRRPLLAVLALLTIPVATETTALGAMLVLAGLTCALVAYEAVRFRKARHRLHADESPEVRPWLDAPSGGPGSG